MLKLNEDIIDIQCNLYRLRLEDKILSPDIEMRWNDGYYATVGRTHHGLQCDNNKNYNEIMEKCNEIATKMFELYDILEKEK